MAEVRDRAEELPYELHFARVRVAELRKEAAQSTTAEIEAEVERTQALLPEADAKLREQQAENDALHAAYGSALQMRTANMEAEREATFELARLQRLGPQVEVAVPQSPNTI